MKLRNSLQLMGALALAATLSTSVGAQDGAASDDAAPQKTKRDKTKGRQGSRNRPADPLMTAIDVDKSGSLSADELAKAPTALIALDKNEDGKLTREELAPGRGKGKSDKKGGGDRFASLDKNGDGKIAKDELPERMQARFADMDKNGDGFIDKEEQKAMMQRGRGGREGREDRPKDGKPEDGAPKPEGDRQGRGQNRGQGQGRGQGRGQMRGGQRGGGSMIATALDTDRDRTISADEIRNATASLRKLDKNNDGELSADELRPKRGGSGFIGRFDTDGDGKISRDEAPGRMADHFDTLDANGDGFVDAAEMDEMMKRRRGGHRGGGRGDRQPDRQEDDK